MAVACVETRESVADWKAPNKIGAAPDAARIYKVAICCITRRRPRLLRALVRSWSRLEIPGNVEPIFIVIENGSAGTERVSVNGLAPELQPYRLLYDIESDIGIPFARNKAVDLALEHGAELILFVDDDEVASPFWLSEMIDTYANSDLMLIGGPVEAALPQEGVNTFRKIIGDGVKVRFDEVARRAAKNLRIGRQHDIKISTNNWLGDARLFTEYGLRFDTALDCSGGSDNKFYRQVRELGLPTGWASRALVYETMSPDRLTLSYQFRRGMEQSRSSFHTKSESRGRAITTVISLVCVVLRSLLVCGTVLALPFLGGTGLVRIARSGGWIVGRITGLFGVRSELYRATTGY